MDDESRSQSWAGSNARVVSTVRLIGDQGEIGWATLPIEVHVPFQFRLEDSFFQVFEVATDERGQYGLAREIDRLDFGAWVSNKRLVAEHDLVEFFAGRPHPLDRGKVTEGEIAAAVLAVLEPHFIVERQVTGTHVTGSRVVLDAILQPRDRSSWKDPNIAIGIEFKSPMSPTDRGRRNSDLLAQCLDYSMSVFGEHGRVPVLICPLPPGLKNELGVMRFIARYHVGYVDFVPGDIRFRLGDQVLWSERKGVTGLGKRWSPRLRSGNRSIR